VYTTDHRAALGIFDENKTIAQVARDLDVTAPVLRTWVRARANRDGGKTGVMTEQRAELAALRKELYQLWVHDPNGIKIALNFANAEAIASGIEPELTASELPD
jgi:transposase-like protein